MDIEHKVIIGFLIFKAIAYAGISIYLIISKLSENYPDLNCSSDSLNNAQGDSNPSKPIQGDGLPIGGCNLVGDGFVKDGDEFVCLH